MGLNNITMITRNGEDRILFDSYTEQNDVNKDTGKVGVRCHHWFTAFFLWLFFDKIVYLTAADGTVYNVNKNSYNNWLARQKDELKIEKAELPTAEEVVARHKEILAAAVKAKQDEEALALQQKQMGEALALQQKQKEEALALQAKKEYDAATLIQSMWRGKVVRAHFPELKKVKTEIDQLRKTISQAEKAIADGKATLEKDLADLVELKESHAAKIKELEGQHQDLLVKLQAKKLVIQNMEKDILKQEGELQKAQNSLSLAIETSQEPKKAVAAAKSKAQKAKAKLEAEKSKAEAELKAATDEKAPKEENKLIGFFKDLGKDTPEELQAKIKELTPQIEALESKIKGYDEQFEKIEQPVTANTHQVKQLAAALQSLKETFARDVREAKEIESQMDQDQAHNIKCFKEMVKNIEPKKLELQKKYEAQKADNEEVISFAEAELVEKLAAYETVISKMKGIKEKAAEVSSESTEDAAPAEESPEAPVETLEEKPASASEEEPSVEEVLSKEEAPVEGEGQKDAAEPTTVATEAKETLEALVDSEPGSEEKVYTIHSGNPLGELEMTAKAPDSGSLPSVEIVDEAK